MSLTEHTGLSEEDVRAAEVLDVLRNSHGLPQSQSVELQDQDFLQDQKECQKVKQDLQVPTLLDRVRRNSIISNVVSLYEMNTRKRSASPSTSSSVVGTAVAEDSNALQDDNDVGEIEDDDEIQSVSKRQKLSDAIAKSRGNLKEYQLNMSIGSKKRLIACLHLLKLANKQLTQRVAYLQEQVEREKFNGSEVGKEDNGEEMEKTLEENGTKKHSFNSCDGVDGEDEDDDDDDDDDDDEYFDASESVDDDKSTVIKMEVVGTVKKVYSLISKFAGNSLPEPARAQVRQTLLNLPTNWSLSVSNSSSSPASSSTVHKIKRSKKQLTTNGKILILAEESLNVVRNVMNVVDSSLGKAEEWVKQKQELKEILKERFVQQQWKKQVRDQLTKEKEEEKRIHGVFRKEINDKNNDQEDGNIIKEEDLKSQ